MTTVINHAALQEDFPDIRPPMAVSLGWRSRALGGAVVAAAGAAVGFGTSPTPYQALVGMVAGATVLTALAANWSTCGMSVAGVVAAPKQPERKGSSTPIRRLGWHAAGSVSTAVITGALIGAIGSLALGWLAATAMVAVAAVVGLAYGLHELGAITLPTPMRRKQLPRHLRRRMAPWKVSLIFGAIIGPGFLIFIRSSAYYLLAIGVALAGSPLLGAGAFAVVALGRCMPSALAIVHTRRGGSMPGFLTLMCLIDRRVQAVTGAAMIGIAAFGLAALL